MRSIHPKASPFEVSDLDETKQHLTPHGVTLKEKTRFPGQKQFSFLTRLITE
jgi:hypothetical protein